MFITIAASLLVQGCFFLDTQEIEEVLLTKENVSLSVKSELIFTYDADVCQLAYNADRNEFVAMTDDASEYFVLAAKEKLSHLGQDFSANLTYMTSSRMKIIENIDFTIEKIDDSSGMIWAWCPSKKIGVVVRTL